MKVIINKPTFINDRDINDCSNNFCKFIEEKLGIKLGRFYNQVTLEFSDEDPKYNLDVTTLSLKEVKEELFDLLGYNHEINNASSIGQIKMMLERLGKTLKEEIWKKIDDIIRSYGEYEETINYIAGEYIDSIKTIKLYNKVIQMTKKGMASIDKYYEVFIHEMFHAFHYYYGESKKEEEIFTRRDYTSKIVKESLASYFEVEFCRTYGISTNVDSSWKTDILKSPYSGARYINGWEHFKKVFDYSIKDMDNALRCLLDKYSFYRVKNAVIIKKRPLPVPSPVAPVPPVLTKGIPQKPYCDKAHFKIYLIPKNEREFFERLMDNKQYNILIYYTDGTNELHEVKSNLKDINKLKSNILTQRLLKKSTPKYSNNPKFDEISYVIVYI